MPVVNAKEMLLEATRGGYAVGAFNITNIIQMEAVVQTAVEMKSPLMIQTSVAPSKFLGRDVLVAITRSLAQAAPIPICLHLDHCTSVQYCQQCADSGYTNIMIDASKQPYEENIRQSKAVTDYCHALGGITVEGELGTVGGVEDQIKVAEDEAQLANPEQAVEFVKRTGIDLLAPAIGTAHGVYKTANPKVDFDRLAEIGRLLNGDEPTVPLVVHGGTGLPVDTVRRLVAAGGAKFNVSTDLKRALIDSTYDYISEHRTEYNPGKIDIAVNAAIKARIAYWIDLLGSAGKAG